MKHGFTRFLTAYPDRLHAAAHSHHPWPDVTYEAHLQAWEDANRLADDKWDHVFGEVFASARRRVAAVLGLPDPDTVVFAPNTHEFVRRIVSNLPRPFRVLTTDSEFHSFARQLHRWEQAGVAEATRVSAQPFAAFPERFVTAYRRHDLVYFSHVHFNSGYVTPGLVDLVQELPEEATVVVDGYHGFMAVPTDLASLAARAFYLAGGYKYAMAGEGACFLHVPDGAPAAPVDTGWWAGFGSLTAAPEDVPYAPGGQRFAGATFDPSGVYRLEAVGAWLDREGVTVEDIHRHVVTLQDRLLSALPGSLTGRLIPDTGERGHFLTFHMPEAEEMYRRLHDRDVITDYRADRWRVGLGVYHDEGDIDRLATGIAEVI